MNHPRAAAGFTSNTDRTTWHDQALWFVREKRDTATAAVPEWESLRRLASDIKEHTLSHLDEYLTRFDERARANGIEVHWARDADEHNRIVHRLLRAHGAQRVVKSKSMLTEECGLNPYLEDEGFEVVDTDLGERIVQLAEQGPSHIVMPAIHLKKEEVGEVFAEKLGTEAGASDAGYLTEAARQHLRAEFLSADAALTGVNFAVAETGGFVVCTNEGNADLGTHLAPLHIASMGIEKVIPRAADLAVFQRLLARSATGQATTVYASHFHRPRPGQQLHVIVVDNGRSAHLGRPEFWRGLKCIRCGACLNTCPVYRRSGGHSYGTPIPGPIGSVLMPGLQGSQHADLPFASTLCGSCSDVCPVRIDLHQQLYAWREVLAEQDGATPQGKARAMRLAGFIFSRPRLYRAMGRWMRRIMRYLPHRIGRLHAWGRARELPEPPSESFHEWYVRNRAS